MKITIALLISIIIVSCNDQTIETTTTSIDSINSTVVKDTPTTEPIFDSAIVDTAVVETPLIETSVIDTPALVKSLSKKILTLLKQRDYKSLANYFHPTKGVRFSPYGYIDIAKDQKLSGAQFLKLTASEQKLTWGIHSGSGDPIVLSIPQYFKTFVYNADFLNAEKTGYNKMIGKGNSLNNLLKVYPTAHFTESHFSGFDKKYDGMDWTSLRLVFEPYKNSFYLVAIIHDQWTT